jgi:hypothetical protein
MPLIPAATIVLNCQGKHQASGLLLSSTRTASVLGTPLRSRNHAAVRPKPEHVDDERVHRMGAETLLPWTKSTTTTRWWARRSWSRGTASLVLHRAGTAQNRHILSVLLPRRAIDRAMGESPFTTWLYRKERRRTTTRGTMIMATSVTLRLLIFSPTPSCFLCPPRPRPVLVILEAFFCASCLVPCTILKGGTTTTIT